MWRKSSSRSESSPGPASVPHRTARAHLSQHQKSGEAPQSKRQGRAPRDLTSQERGTDGVERRPLCEARFRHMKLNQRATRNPGSARMPSPTRSRRDFTTTSCGAGSLPDFTAPPAASPPLLPHHRPPRLRSRANGLDFPDFAGGALWFAPGEIRASRRIQTLRELAVLAPALWGFGACAVRSLSRPRRDATDPSSDDHWYLETLSIAPARQRSGSRHRAPHSPLLERCDAEGLPAYPRNPAPSRISRTNERFGFSLQDEITAL